jgi:hypothetical protein
MAAVTVTEKVQDSRTLIQGCGEEMFSETLMLWELIQGCW